MFHNQFVSFFLFTPDIDECRYGYCQQLCANVPGSYSCSCNPGFILNTDSRTCQGTQTHTHTGRHIVSVVSDRWTHSPVVPPDVDECADEPCTHACFNTYGSFMCNCDEGFELAADGTSCIGETSWLCCVIITNKHYGDKAANSIAQRWLIHMQNLLEPPLKVRGFVLSKHPNICVFCILNCVQSVFNLVFKQGDIKICNFTYLLLIILHYKMLSVLRAFSIWQALTCNIDRNWYILFKFTFSSNMYNYHLNLYINYQNIPLKNWKCAIDV